MQRGHLTGGSAVLSWPNRECVFTGSAWAEGPLWVPSSQTVRWSDIPNDRILEFSQSQGCQGRRLVSAQALGTTR
ncbi:hypothetical protein DXK94_04310 [Arthrobacter sp. RT-1]|nr:hypothetical protein DXK94_04310 [Arthrobacter sp. RT-1]